MWWQKFTVTSGSYACAWMANECVSVQTNYTVSVLADRWQQPQEYEEITQIPIPITVRPYPPKQFALFLSSNKNTKIYLSWNWTWN